MEDLNGYLSSSRTTLSFDRYVFSAAEENVWGPDFALLFTFIGTNGFNVNRYVLFQAKLIKNSSVRIPTEQMATFLRTTWHSSFYLFWCHGTGPRSVSAALLREVMENPRPARRHGASPTISWSEIEPYTDSLPALLGDRFLCGELGDDPQMPGASSVEIARRISDLFGRPRLGVLSIRAVIGTGDTGQMVFGDTSNLDIEHE